MQSENAARDSGLSQSHLVLVGDVPGGKVEVGKRVVVMGEIRWVLKPAIFLQKRRKKVTVTRRGPEMPLKVEAVLRPYLENNTKNWTKEELIYG